MTLRELRKERHLSLEAVAYLADIDVATISRVERGLTQPRRETVVRLARALGMSVSRMAALLQEGTAGPPAVHLAPPSPVPGYAAHRVAEGRQPSGRGRP